MSGCAGDLILASCVPEIKIKQEQEEYNEWPESDNTERDSKYIGDICKFHDAKVEETQVNDTEEHEIQLEKIKVEPEYTELTEKGQSKPGKDPTDVEWSHIRNRLVAKPVGRTQGTESKLYPCDFPGCGRAFRQPGTLRSHVRRHTPEEQYQCEVEGCGRSFTVRYQLRYHMRVHTGERGFRCEFPGCRSAFYQKSALNRHRLIHTDDKRFECDHARCDRAFHTKYSLQVHKRVHTSERQFQCSVGGCGQKFGFKYHLRRHMDAHVHTGLRPFVCNFEGCGAGFRKKSSLTIHARTHTGEPYKGRVRKHPSSYHKKQKPSHPDRKKLQEDMYRKIQGNFRLIAPKLV